MKLKMAADRVLKRFWRENRKEDAFYAKICIMQSIFRSASRRETLGKHSKGGRRGGELKIDWTEPPPRA
jgi:hypothetical protein